MSTQAQINANRLNAQKSTGPKSPEGKATVAKNAVKHGYFALDTVIAGEDREEYDSFRDALIEELAPDGAMQTMLAERAVSLSWRLKRIEHIQNQVIEAMLERDFDNPLSKQIQKLVPEHLRQKKSEHLALGYVTLKDYANSRAMDRLLMYERRLENSLFRTTNELRKLKIIKEFEQTQQPENEGLRTQDGKPEPKVTEMHSVPLCHCSSVAKNARPHALLRLLPRPASRDAAASEEKQWGEKQSQFASTMLNATSSNKNDYDNTFGREPLENKPNQSQSFDSAQDRFVSPEQFIEPAKRQSSEKSLA